MSSLNSSGGFRSRTKRGAAAEKQQGRQQHQGHNQGQRNSQGRNHSQRRTNPHTNQPPARQHSRQRPRRSSVDPARVVALEVLRRVSEDDAYANLVLPGLLKEEGVRGRDAAFATEITYGTLRHLGVLDEIIQDCSTRDIFSLDDGVLDALRLGVYQLLYTRVSPHAAVDTTVSLVEEQCSPRGKGFANAVMRAVSKHPLEWWLDRLQPQGEIAAIAFKESHPTWIAESFAKALGIGELAEALKADSERPQVHLVARPGEITAEELALITGGEVGQYSPYAVRLSEGAPKDLDVIREGLAGVQDEGSQLIARALVEGPIEGEDQGRWLDLCAGPGGKTALIASLARIDQAHVDAVEISEHRAKLVRQATDSLQDVCEVHVADGRNPGLTPGYDRVLVDAPCSGLGSLRRRPEARWRKRESDIAELTALQKELLESAVKLTRPGGLIIYSTCSPDLRETRGVVDWAIANLGVEELNAHELVPTMESVGSYPSVQMWPHRHGTDAMFFAALRLPATTPDQG